MTRFSLNSPLSTRAGALKAAAFGVALSLAAAALADAAGAQDAGQRPQQVASASGRRASARRAAPTAADSAITRLESFLQRYPDSALRPNALFELGELLVRRADERSSA